MKFYFDESGNFQVPTDPAKHAVGIVSGVVIPDSHEAYIFREFDAFVATLPASAFKNGEPKGNRLNDSDLQRFAEMLLNLKRGILFCPIMLDLTSLIGKSEANISAIVSAAIVGLRSTCKHPLVKQAIGELGTKVGLMSNQQIMRLAAWAKCINRCISESFVFHSSQDFEGDWSNLRFEIDPVQQHGGTEEEAFAFLVRSWLVAWSHESPLITIEGIHTPDHPLMKNWDTAEGIDIGAMFKNNMHYVPSDQSKGIQLADMTATLIRRAVIGLATAPSLRNYALMMTKTIGKPQWASGLIFFGNFDQLDIQKRYHGIADVISACRRAFPQSYALG